MLTPQSKRRTSRERGAALVEMALVTPFLLLLLLGIIEFGYKFGQYNGIRHAVREGARFAAADAGSNASLEQFICQALQGIDAGMTEVRLAWSTDPDGDSNTDVGEPATIRVEADVSSLTNAPLISVFLPDTLSSEVQFRLERSPTQWSSRTLSATTDPSCP
jgi:Flp pilus assembly protein TadG